MGIGYHLLSDEGSRVIREVGVYDNELAKHAGEFGLPVRPAHVGIAFPTIFMLDALGRVVERRTDDNYRLRESAPRLLRRLALDGTGTPSAEARPTTADGIAVEVADGPLRVRVALDGSTYFPYQRRDVWIDLSLAEGWHVYGRRAPEGTAALNVTLSSQPDGVRVESVQWPPAATLVVAGDPVPAEVYSGSVRLVVPVSFVVDSGWHGWGDIVLSVAVDFQTCNATQCLPPSRLVAELRIPEAAVP